MAETITSISEYLQTQPPEVQAILKQIRALVYELAPAAQERLSYGMPAYFLHGVLLYVGAFKKHIGLYPPVRDPALLPALAPYAGPKGNLQFPLNAPIPYDLIRHIVVSRVRENQTRRGAQ